MITTFETTFDVERHKPISDEPTPKPITDHATHTSRHKRQSTFSDARSHHDATIAYLLSAIPNQIERAIEVTETAQRFKVFKRVTQGWAIVIGSWLDVYSDFVINNRSLGNFGSLTTVYANSGKGFYGVGFGFPLLLGLPEDKLLCGPQDFLRTLDEYQLTGGLADLFAGDAPASAWRSVVSEFDLWARTKLACILDFEAEIREAAELGFALEQLTAAMNLRIDVEEADRSKALAEQADRSNEVDVGGGIDRWHRKRKLTTPERRKTRWQHLQFTDNDIY
jgi:hypothetical protein